MLADTLITLNLCPALSTIRYVPVMCLVCNSLLLSDFKAHKAEPSAADRDFETPAQAEVCSMIDYFVGSVIGYTCTSLHILSGVSYNHLHLALTESGLKLLHCIPVACTSYLRYFLSDALSDSHSDDLDLILDLDLDFDLDLLLEFDLNRKQELNFQNSIL
ncbi:MAG: hypothetical protein EZS28_027230 [Streblomastix strix]|uniref:Uncharacterized protein n=1 Tax=Streblomastix strix TaxID=222440 RepID=A0A5J4V4B2_9EUKA|nr:MAG: hypothetical protein EZS28_027230 [Streblomastix strix]